MSEPTHYFRTGDVGPLQCTLKRAGVAVDLSTATDVTYVMRRVAAGAIAGTKAGAVVEPATGGVVTCTLSAIDTATSGVYLYTVRVTFADGTVTSFPTRGTASYLVEASLDLVIGE